MYGTRGDGAVKSEMGQLHEREVMQPVHTKELSRQLKKEALVYLMFLKQN